jgi:hypothetical protein
MKDMKYLFAILLIGFLVAIIVTPKLETETHQETVTIDSVEFHPMGHDNTLQFEPYWKIHLKEPHMWTRTHFKHVVGDTMVVSVKTIKNPTH